MVFLSIFSDIKGMPAWMNEVGQAATGAAGEFHFIFLVFYIIFLHALIATKYKAKNYEPSSDLFEVSFLEHIFSYSKSVSLLTILRNLFAYFHSIS